MEIRRRTPHEYSLGLLFSEAAQCGVACHKEGLYLWPEGIIMKVHACTDLNDDSFHKGHKFDMCKVVEPHA